MTSAHHQGEGRSRRPFLRIVALALAVGAAAYFAAERGSQTMATSLTTVLTPPRPSIDTIVPKEVATASFAMG